MIRRRREGGAVLVTVLVLASIMAIFCMTSLLLSTSEVTGTALDIRRDQALFVASAGVEDQLSVLEGMFQTTVSTDYFKNFEALVGKQVIETRTVSSAGRTVGEYEVWVDSVAFVDEYTRDITVRGIGYVPSADSAQRVSRTVTTVVRIGLERSHVFDYVYFINNWGWYYGNTIEANGNVRANGQFDFGCYSPYVNGMPRFQYLRNGTFGTKLDDGGVYAGWNIVNSQKVRGGSAGPENMHAFEDQVAMPNLTDLTMYESMAKTQESNIVIDGKEVCDAVAGDDVGEKSNLYLEGTEGKPIELNGPVVVRGDLIIKGVVSGKGTLYCQGNVYIAGNIIYKKPLGPLPPDFTQKDLENWLLGNRDRDALGLFAREHIIVGDYTNSYFQHYVGPWVYDNRNRSDEDAGEDGIPNTRAGRDGVYGTADDDVLEDDDQWTVEYYTAENEAQGLIPEGAKVGDPIRGSGEDIDGDGRYDDGTQMSEFNLDVPLKDSYWAGNLPDGVGSYRDVCESTWKLNRLDGVFYTNHTFAMLTLDGNSNFTFNGSVVSRNEAIVYGTKKLVLNYDLRLLEETEPERIMLPRTWRPVSIVLWTSN